MPKRPGGRRRLPPEGPSARRDVGASGIGVGRGGKGKQEGEPSRCTIMCVCGRGDRARVFASHDI